MFPIDCTQAKKEYFGETSDSDSTLDQTNFAPGERTVMAQELMLISKERYDRLMKQTSLTNKKDTDGKKMDQDTNEGEKNDSTLLSMIVHSIPKRMNKRAVELYKFIVAQDQNELSHNGQGELVVNGECIKGSHIIDLIRHSVCPGENTPIGDKTFKDILEKLHVPKRLITGKRKCQFKQSGGLFVKRRGGRRDVVPGMRNTNEKKHWLKY